MKKQLLAPNYRLILSAFIFILIFVSCESNFIEEIETPTISQNNCFVDLIEAKSIASNIQYNLTNKVSEDKQIENTLAVPDENGEIVYYIINYKKQGFIIISADKRVNPILAYSINDVFPVDSEKYPNGLVEWLVNSKETVKSIRNRKQKLGKERNFAWQSNSIQDFINSINGQDSISKYEDPIDPDDCENYNTTIGPFLSTTWGQWGGYNDLVPYKVAIITLEEPLQDV